MEQSSQKPEPKDRPGVSGHKLWWIWIPVVLLPAAAVFLLIRSGVGITILDWLKDTGLDHYLVPILDNSKVTIGLVIYALIGVAMVTPGDLDNKIIKALFGPILALTGKLHGKSKNDL